MADTLAPGCARALSIAGALAILFVAYEFLVTGVPHDRAQSALLPAFRDAVRSTTLDAPRATMADGSPVALLDVPQLGAPMVVIEGTSPDDLKSGPGHLHVSPFPGEFGNAVIAARRTTYGGPFGKLDQLHRDDAIRVTTGQGTFTYRVSAIRRVGAGDAEPLTGTLDSRLTLVTSDPAFFASQRLAVVASLQGQPVAVPKRAPAFVTAADLGLALDPIWLARAAGWALLLALAIAVAGRMRRHWPAPVTLMFATPVLLGLAVLLFSSVDGTLPGTL